MLKIALRNLWEHKLRTILLGLAVVAGVGFVSASYIFTDSLSLAFEEAFSAGTEGVDIAVTPVTEDEGGAGGGATFPRFDEAVVDDVAAVEGVARVTPWLQAFVTIVVEGEEPQPFGAPDFGISWTDTGPYDLVDGRAPDAADEVMMDAASADRREVEVGDSIDIAATGRAQTFTVVGTFGFGEGGAGFGATFAALTFEQAAELFEVEGQVNAIDVIIDEGVEVDAMVSSINDVLPESAEAVDARQAAEEQAAELQEGISFFNVFLLVFGAIALVVGAFVVYNAFRVVVAQRGRELALLRILGTTRRQLLRSVLSEAVVVGFVASLIGVGLGVVLAVGIRALLAATGGELPDAGLVVSPRTVLLGVVVGLVTTLVSAIVPAIRATRISPMEALRDQPDLRRVKPWWSWVGGALLVGAIGLVVYGVGQARGQAALTGDTDPLVIIGVGCLGAFGAMFLLARSLAKPVLRFLGAGARTTATVLGRENARRTPRRTAVTASALMIGLGLVATVAVLSRSVEDTILGAVDEAFTSEIFVQAAGFDPFVGFSTEVGGVVEDVDGIDGVARSNILSIGVPGGDETLALGVEPETVDLVAAFEEVQGTFEDLGPGTVGVQRIEADNQGWEVGDSIDLEIQGSTVSSEIVAIFDYAGQASDSQSYYLSYDDVAGRLAEPRDVMLSVSTEPDRNVEEVATELEEALADFPSVAVNTVSDLIGQIQSALAAVVGMVAGLMFMSVLVAVVGIVLTLYLAVFERTRETGMLRAVGMTRRQVRRMIRFESILIAVFGTVLGLALGLFSGWALSIGVVGEGARLGVPWVWIIAGMGGALVAGVLAAVIPARRASRLDILQAIAYE